MSATKKKIIVMCVAMMITIASMVCSTIAFFTDSAQLPYGDISIGSVSVQIIDVTYPYGSNVPIAPDEAIRIFPGYEVKKTVTARNMGDLPMYVRIKLDSEITLAESSHGREAEIDRSLVGYDINLENWLLHTDGYYYYRTPLTKGKEATPLFTKVKFSEDMGNLYKDSTIRFKVRMEVVQANNNGASVTEAQGWTEPLYEGGGQ